MIDPVTSNDLDAPAAIPIVVRVTNTADLLYHASREISRHMKSYWWLRVIVVIGPILMVLITIAGGVTLRSAIVANLFWIIGTPLAWFVLVPLLQRWNIRRVFRATPAAHGEQVYSFDDGGVAIVAGHSRGSLDWSGIVRTVEGRDAFLLFLNRQNAYYLPRSSFASEGDIERFRLLLAKRVQARR